jgi:hypothetical protein
MVRYFFDVRTDIGVEYDYSGALVVGFEQAVQIAELRAMDAACTPLEGRTPMEVQVHDAAGRQLLSVAVRPLDALAA